MAHIFPQLPADGQQNWAPTADAYLVALLNQINLHDDLIAAGGIGGGGGPVIVDNGDGTITILPSGTTNTTATPGLAGVSFDTDGVPILTIT